MSLRHFVVQEENREKGPEGHGQGGVRDLTARWGYQARSNLVPGEYMSTLVSWEILQCSNIGSFSLNSCTAFMQISGNGLQVSTVVSKLTRLASN